ncbi:MAG: hypothetical protein Tsb009_08920 [Planctomycetaceae bacterium]
MGTFIRLLPIAAIVVQVMCGVAIDYAEDWSWVSVRRSHDSSRYWSSIFIQTLVVSVGLAIEQFVWMMR